VLARVEPRSLALAHDTAGLVDECERAADVLADDRQECRRTPSLEDGMREPLVDLECPLDACELRVRELRRDRLRQCDERHVVGDRDQRKAHLLGLVGERRGRLGPAEADAEREARQAVLGEAADVLALGPGELAYPEPRRDQELAALEPGSRVGQLGDVHPADRVVGAGRRRAGGSSPRPGRFAMSRTVSIDGAAALGRLGQDATPCRVKKQAITRYEHAPRVRLSDIVSKSGGAAVRTSGPLHTHVAAGEKRACPLRERTTVDGVLEAREALRRARRGDAALVVTRAEGAQVEAADGNLYLDFAGGIACQNTGHGFAPVVAAIHEQVDKFLHQCFMVGTYESYVEVCRRLAEHSPCAGENQKSILVNSGAEAIENAVKIARAATGGSGVVVFDNGFHGRTLLTMAMTSKCARTRPASGRSRPRSTGRLAPYPYRGIDSDDAIAALEHLFKSEVEAESLACVVLETVQGEGGFIAMPPDYLARLAEVCKEHGILYVADEVQCGVGRTGPMWAVEHYEGVEPDLVVSGKSLGGGLPLAAVTGRAEIMDVPAPGGLGGTFGGNPVACAAQPSCSTPSRSRRFALTRTSSARNCAAVSMKLSSRHEQIGEVRGLGPMLALELREQSADLAGKITAAAFERGLLLLSCGLYGNVIRLLPPLTVTDDELERGLQLLEESLAAAG
jgi:4-aminobutyrate aminotransferase